MVDTNQEREEKRVNSIAREYRRKGYRVTINPGLQDLPDFLRNFRPDLIAKNELESVIVEVKSQPSLSRNHELEELAQIVKYRTGWRLELVVTNPKGRILLPDRAELPDQAAVQSRISEAESLMKAGRFEAAMLIGWSAAEGYFRLIANQQQVFLERESTNYILKKIYSLGLITKRTFDIFDTNLRIRNSLVHGFTQFQLDEKSAEAFIEEVKRLRRELLNQT